MLVPPLNAAYCKLVFPYFVGVYLRANVILQGLISLRNSSQPTLTETECEVLLYVVLYSAMSWYISQGKQVGHELIYLLRPWI